MKPPLDTHVFIWWDSEPDRLSERALAALQERENDICLSVVSLWEMQIKSQLGKLKLRLPLAEIVAEQQVRNQLSVIPFSLAHVLELDHLPALHRDPFDRALFAQAKVEKAHLVSRDAALQPYAVTVVW